MKMILCFFFKIHWWSKVQNQTKILDGCLVRPLISIRFGWNLVYIFGFTKHDCMLSFNLTEFRILEGCLIWENLHRIEIFKNSRSLLYALESSNNLAYIVCYMFECVYKFSTRRHHPKWVNRALSKYSRLVSCLRWQYMILQIDPKLKKLQGRTQQYNSVSR